MQRLWAIVVLALLAGAVRAQGIDGAVWRAQGGAAGVRPLSGADGVTRTLRQGGALALANQPGTTPPSTYLYFDIDDGRARKVSGPVFVTVEYYDDGIGSALSLEYDADTGEEIGAKYRLADARAGGWALGTKRWQRVCFELRRPRFANRQNLGADFRISGTLLALRSVRLSRTRPSDWTALSRIDTRSVKPLVKIGAGGQLIIGGFDPARVADAEPQAQALEAALPALKALGVTSHEGYVRWNLCERAPGVYDWSVYDRFVRIYRRHGLKWVPFLIVGSAYSLPDWVYKKPGSQGYVCLEHGQATDVQSLWNPVLRQHVARFLKAFCARYGKSGVVESILLGVTGNYGEAIYPVTGNDWTADIHGAYHSHPGYWCGDPFAVADFRRWLTRKYRSDAGLRAAWGKSAPTLAKVRPFLRSAAPSDRAWLDLCGWYIGSMTDWSAFWLRTTRSHWSGDLSLCTGGHAPPEHGANFSEQCRVAAASRAGVRITNEASDYAANFVLTRAVASAGRQYGAHFSFEPAGVVDAQGVVARIYNATASGARGLHYYFPNLFGSDAARANFVRWGGQFRQRKPSVPVAVYYPQTAIELAGSNGFLDVARPLRDRFDFDFLSDSQIRDGGLKRVKALVILDGARAEASTWKRVLDWARGGGVVYLPSGLGPLRTVEGDDRTDRALRALATVRVLPGRGTDPPYRAAVARDLARRGLVPDGDEDGVFVTKEASGSLLLYNATARPVRRFGVEVPAGGIGTVPPRR